MRALVCGGRDYADREQLFSVLDAAGVSHVIQGGARGADTLAFDWAHARGLTVQTFVADWKKHGRGAGPMRNQRMLDEGRPDLVIAFPGGRGTADMIRRARAAGIPVREVVLR